MFQISPLSLRRDAEWDTLMKRLTWIQYIFISCASCGLFVCLFLYANTTATALQGVHVQHQIYCLLSAGLLPANNPLAAGTLA